MKNRESDTGVILSGVLMLVIASAFYAEGYAGILLAMIFGFVLQDVYCRTSYGRRANRKLRAFFRRKPSST